MPDEGSGLGVVVTDAVEDGADEAGDAGERTAANAVVMISRRNLSTILSQDALVGVKWLWNRGWRASHRLTAGCLCVT